MFHRARQQKSWRINKIGFENFSGCPISGRTWQFWPLLVHLDTYTFLTLILGTLGMMLRLVMFIFFSRLFSAFDVLRIIPTNMVSPFMYLVDIIKDSLQLYILLISIGGIKNVIQNPTSFSSVVSTLLLTWYFLKTLLIVLRFCVKNVKGSHFEKYTKL